MVKGDYMGICMIKYENNIKCDDNNEKEEIGITIWMYPCEEVNEWLRDPLSSSPDFDKVIPFKKKDDNNVGPLIGLTQNPTLEELTDSFEIRDGCVTPLALMVDYPAQNPSSVINYFSQNPSSEDPFYNFLYLIEKGENQFCLSLCVDFKKSIEQIKELYEDNKLITNMSQDEIQELLNLLQDNIEEFLLQAYPQSSEELPTGHDLILKEIITNVPKENMSFKGLKEIVRYVIIKMNAHSWGLTPPSPPLSTPH